MSSISGGFGWEKPDFRGPGENERGERHKSDI